MHQNHISVHRYVATIGDYELEDDYIDPKSMILGPSALASAESSLDKQNIRPQLKPTEPEPVLYQEPQVVLKFEKHTNI